VSHPTTRVLAMLELLQARHQLSGAELAAGLGVDQRTIRRYALRLADLGIPVTAERGRYGGYRLLPGYRLPPLMLTDDEAAAVVIGLLAAERLGQPVAGLAAALTKIQRVLPTALAERVAALRQTLGFTQHQKKPAVAADTGTVLTLAHAASQRQRVQIRYRSHAEQESERDLDPYGLVLHSGRWYVTGHDSNSGQVRTFRVDHISGAGLTGASFALPGGFDPVQHVARSLAAVPYAHEVEVVLTTTLDDAKRRIPPTFGTLTETDGGVLFQARANDLKGAAVMLAGLGWPFTVRRPAALVTEVRALSDRLRAWSE
jgi:predicted DNA-binding transcriptional regulator YafY